MHRRLEPIRRSAGTTGKDVEALIVEVAEAAVADAGLVAADIDEIVLGPLWRRLQPAGLYQLTPATRVETGGCSICVLDSLTQR